MNGLVQQRRTIVEALHLLRQWTSLSNHGQHCCCCWRWPMMWEKGWADSLLATLHWDYLSVQPAIQMGIAVVWTVATHRQILAAAYFFHLLLEKSAIFYSLVLRCPESFFVVPFSTPTRSVLRCRSRCKGVAAAATVEKTPLKKTLSTVWQLRSRVARVRKCNGYATTTFDVSVWRSNSNSESTRLSHVCCRCNFVFSFLFSLRIGISSSSSTDC